MAESALPRPSVSYRWMVLVFISLAQGGNYYIYDSINPLEDIFKQHLGFTSTSFGWLNSSYSVASLATLLIGGIVVDRIGTKKALAFFGGLCLLGAMLTAWRGNVMTMVAGRTVLGLGAESMIVTVTVALAKWFKGKELGFAFGINLTIARLASVAADNSPTWAHTAFYPNGDAAPPSWQRPLFVAVGAGVLCVLAAAIYWALESYAEGKYELGLAGEVDKLEFGQAFRFDASYWYVVMLCFTFYSAIFPFRTFAVEFFQSKLMAGYGLTAAQAIEKAGFLNSVLPLSAMVATPLFGLLVDRVGRRALFMVFGSVLLLPVYLMMAYGHMSLLVPVVMLGIAFSLLPAILWPSVAYIVDASRLGAAYALMTFIQQIGLFGLNSGIGLANDSAHASVTNPGGYGPMMWILSGLGFVGLLFAVLLRIRETGPKGHGLETITAATST